MIFWNNLGKPQGVNVKDSYQGAISVQDPVPPDLPPGTFPPPPRDYAFVRCSDGNLWVNWENGPRLWSNQGRPAASTHVVKVFGATTVNDTPQPLQRPYAWVLGSDGNLWSNWWNGSQWAWHNHGNPAGSPTIAGPVGVMTVKDTPQERPYAFVLGSDGNLWSNWWNGSQWLWHNHGKPPASPGIAASVGVITVRDTPQAAQRPYAFVLGNAGNLWSNWWNGSQWLWHDHGNPPGSPTIAGPVGVTTVQDTPQAAQIPHAFVRGSDGNLWVNWWTGTVWDWTNLGNPPGSPAVAGPFGVRRGRSAFVLGSDGNLWEAWWNSSAGSWAWTNWGNPAGSPAIAGPVGMAEGGAYAVGSDGNLWQPIVGPDH